MISTPWYSSPWLRWGIALVTLVVLVRVVIGGWNTWSAPAPVALNAPPAASSPDTQINEAGQITVKATWQGPDAGPVFAIVMDTHAVDLDGYDLRRLAVLRIDNGQEIPPTGWDAPKGGHHRAGTLTFPTTAADGTPPITANTRTIELIIRDVGDVPERTFTWTR